MPDEDRPDIAMLDSRVVYENRWMRVREDSIRRRDGSKGLYGVVEKPDFVVIIAAEADGSIHLVEQYRYPVQGRYWEAPQGSWEETPDADPVALARGELQEETGLVAGRMTHVGHLFHGYGYSNQGYHVFLAQDLAQGDARREHEEQDLITRCFPQQAVAEMILSGQIKDASTVAALGLLRLRGMLGA